MNTKPSINEGRAEAAAYIADLTRDLTIIARRHRLEVLAYLLEMAKLEAENEAQPNKRERKIR